MTFVNTKPGFAWLTLYLETIISALSWKTMTSATLALQFKRNLAEWITKTDPDNMWFKDYGCHDFSARGMSPFDMLSSGLGHAASHRGSDSLIVIPAARYFYGEPENEVAVNSVNASEHSVTCTNIFYYKNKLENGEMNESIEEYYAFNLPADGTINEPDYLAIAEWIMLRAWLKEFPTGILSYVCDTFDTWKSATQIVPRLKKEIMARDGKLVLRPDTGDPADIICGINTQVWSDATRTKEENSHPSYKGVVELLWDTFEGTINSKELKVLDTHIGCIYGDSINLERQIDIYQRLFNKEFACTNIVLGVGSFTYQMNTRDTLGLAAKGAWFAVTNNEVSKGYNIYKDPITGDGSKKSLKGLIQVYQDQSGEYVVKEECTGDEEEAGILQTIYFDGNFLNQTTLKQIREKLEENL